MLISTGLDLPHGIFQFAHLRARACPELTLNDANITHSLNIVGLLSSFTSKWSSWGPRLSIMVGLQLFASLWPDFNSRAYKIVLWIVWSSASPPFHPLFVTVSWQMFDCSFSQTWPTLPSAPRHSEGGSGLMFLSQDEHGNLQFRLLLKCVMLWCCIGYQEWHWKRT